MGLIRIESEQLRLWVTPALGGGVARLDMRGPDDAWWPLWRPAPEGATWFNDLASYVLAPWSNRIAGPEFTWEGKAYRLRADWPDGTAIHGCVKDRPMRLFERSPVTARLAFRSSDHEDVNWPFAFECRVRYEVDGPRLLVGLEVKNCGEASMPAGLGAHPFFMRRLWGNDAARVRAGVQKRYPAKEMIPVEPARDDEVCAALRAGAEVDGLRLDDCFVGSIDDGVIEYPASGVHVRLRASEAFTHTVLYTGTEAGAPPLPFFCLEPVTMANNGFNLRGWDEGVRALGPGETLRGTFGLEVSRV